MFQPKITLKNLACCSSTFHAFSLFSVGPTYFCDFFLRTDSTSAHFFSQTFPDKVSFNCQFIFCLLSCEGMRFVVLLSFVLVLGVLSSDLKVTDSVSSFLASKHENVKVADNNNFVIHWSNEKVDGYR